MAYLNPAIIHMANGRCMWARSQLQHFVKR